MNDILDTQFEDEEVELADNKIALGEDLNILEKDPTLKNVLIGVGWDVNAFDADALDLDLSIFLLDKDGQTRVDEDFVFYNMMGTPDGGVKHNGDSRTGAGDGDDESVTLDIQTIHFDIAQILFVVSIYKAEEKDQTMGMVRGAYIRVVNADNGHEVVRYEMKEDLEDKAETAMVVAVLNREGPKWHFKPIAEFVDGGLAAIATRYGLSIISQ